MQHPIASCVRHAIGHGMLRGQKKTGTGFARNNADKAVRDVSTAFALLTSLNMTTRKQADATCAN